MRKKVSMILVSLMMVSAFAACGNIDGSKDSSMSEVSAESTEDELEEAFSKKSSSDTNEEDNYSKSLETAESSDDAINEDSDNESSEGDKDSSNSLPTPNSFIAIRGKLYFLSIRAGTIIFPSSSLV